jgi:hypothetical protein
MELKYYCNTTSGEAPTGTAGALSFNYSGRKFNSCSQAQTGTAHYCESIAYCKISAAYNSHRKKMQLLQT